MKSKRFIVFVIVGVMVIVLLAACSSGGGGSNPAASDSKTFNVSATEFAYTPNTFNAKPGDKLIFKVTNKGTVEHTLVIQSLDGSTELAKLSVQPGETKSLDFTAKDAGIYPIVCDIAGHKAAGMTGTLTVK
jgi:plastocyanin